MISFIHLLSTRKHNHLMKFYLDLSNFKFSKRFLNDCLFSSDYYICVLVSACVCVYLRAYMWVGVPKCVFLWVPLCVYNMYAPVYVYPYVRLCAHAHARVCVYARTPTHT